MKKTTIILLLMSCTALYAQDRETPYQTKSLSGQGIASVEVSTSGGSISVTGVPESEARVEVYVRGNNAAALSKEEIQKRLENYKLDISVSNNSLVAEAAPKERNMNWKRSLNISFKVFVPQKIATRLRTSGGSIQLANLNGTQNFSTSGGSLRVSKVSGKITGRTSGGSIHAEGSSGAIDLSTSGGSVNLIDLSGTIRASTSGGSIKSSNISGQLNAHTSGGSIRMSDLSCTLEASTSGGQIDVDMKALGEYVRLGNSGGSITLQIPASKGVKLDIKGNKVSTSALKNFNGSVKDDEIEGDLNGGGIPVTVNAGSGRVSFSVK